MPILSFPAVGWCVRPGVGRAHYLFLNRGRIESACVGVKRLDEYVPQGTRPRQAGKIHCLSCDLALSRMAGE